MCKLDLPYIDKGIKNHFLKFGFNLLFHNALHWESLWSHWTSSPQKHHFQVAPSSGTAILHCPPPKLSSPSWVLHKSQF